MVGLALKIGVRHDCGRVADEVAAKDAELTFAWREATGSATRIMETSIRDAIPKKTRKTEKTIRSEMLPTPNGGRGQVHTDDPVASYIEHGTRPHVIRPKDAAALHFFIGPREIFATEVHHPGTEPHPFFEQGGLTAKDAIEETYEEAVRGIS